MIQNKFARWKLGKCCLNILSVPSQPGGGAPPPAPRSPPETDEFEDSGLKTLLSIFPPRTFSCKRPKMMQKVGFRRRVPPLVRCSSGRWRRLEAVVRQALRWNRRAEGLPLHEFHLGHAVSNQTMGNVLRRYRIQPAPKRSYNTTWEDFVASHMAVLAGTDFFSVEVLTWRALATYYVLLFIHLESPRASLAGLTRHPTSEWMVQMARNATDENSGFLHGQRYLLHDRDTKFWAAFLDVLRSSGIRPLALPPRSPNLNAFAERWVCSLRQNAFPSSFSSEKLRYAGR